MNFTCSKGDDQSNLQADRILYLEGELRLYQGRGLKERVIDSISLVDLDEFRITHESYPRDGVGVQASIRMVGDKEDTSLPVAEVIEMRQKTLVLTGGAAGDRVSPRRVADVVSFEVKQSLWGDPSKNVALPTVH